MSLGAQLRALNTQVSAFRQDLIGTKEDGTPVTIDYNGGEHRDIVGYYSSIKKEHESEQAGFLQMHDAIVRLRKSTTNFTPELDKIITIKEGHEEIELRIDEIAGTHPLSVEWLLGCKAQN
jgi:hypothetical protein